MGIEALGRLDLVAREGNGYPSARVFGTPWLEPQAVHAHGHALGREACAHVLPHQFDDACCGEELSRLVLCRVSQVGKDEFFLYARFLELAVVAVEFGILLIVKPVAVAQPFMLL